jgi:hypothetical protein
MHHPSNQSCFSFLLAVPHPGDLGLPHLALKLEDAVHEGLTRWGAAGNIYIDRDDPVATADDAVAVVVVASAVGAAAHTDDPAWLRHLIVDLSQSGGHLVGEGSGDNHNVRLTGRSTENDSEAILIVSWSGEVHHFDGAAGQTERHGPQRRLPGPVGHLIKCRQGILNGALCGLLAGQGHLLARTGRYET